MDLVEGTAFSIMEIFGISSMIVYSYHETLSLNKTANIYSQY